MVELWWCNSHFTLHLWQLLPCRNRTVVKQPTFLNLFLPFQLIYAFLNFSVQVRLYCIVLYCSKILYWNVNMMTELLQGFHHCSWQSIITVGKQQALMLLWNIYSDLIVFEFITSFVSSSALWFASHTFPSICPSAGLYFHQVSSHHCMHLLHTHHSYYHHFPPSHSIIFHYISLLTLWCWVPRSSSSQLKCHPCSPMGALSHQE